MTHSAVRPPLGREGTRYARRAGFWVHAISGFGWGLTAPLAWMLGIISLFFLVFGAMPADADGQTLQDVSAEMMGDIGSAPGFSLYLWSVAIACAVFAVVSLIAGIAAFRHWGGGRAFWITVLSGLIPHILIFPVVMGIGTFVTALFMSMTDAPSPLTGELPVSVLVITAVFGVINAVVHGLLGMLCSWLFANAMRPREQLRFCPPPLG
ncbi:MAG: hypothetical protein ACTH1N_10670 [Agrococcus casei]|uniref:hypothetical protein n=1 Tax=Agrococcus casei TaxID=343512 RepID=UPI003F90C38D